MALHPPLGGACPRHALLVPSWHSHLTQLHVRTRVHIAVGQGACLSTHISDTYRWPSNSHMVPGTQHRLSHSLACYLSVSLADASVSFSAGGRLSGPVVSECASHCLQDATHIRECHTRTPGILLAVWSRAGGSEVSLDHVIEIAIRDEGFV